MKKAEVLAAIGKEVTQVWSHGGQPFPQYPVTILGYGYSADSTWRFSTRDRLEPVKGGTAVLVQHRNDRRDVVGLAALVDRNFDEWKAEIARAAQREKRRLNKARSTQAAQTARLEEVILVFGGGTVQSPRHQLGEPHLVLSIAEAEKVLARLHDVVL